ncbi:hypothetical protein [Acidithiobacillus sp.]|uniref:hypothetical protein n=1 Tax=Acidithiobacillus sp. TaxID=1872118 RepID=UPI00260AC441|nr:hypothetical protein [Acidithiobacillus sp.]
MLNVALFGQTAKQWRDANPDAEGNIRDHAPLMLDTNTKRSIDTARDILVGARLSCCAAVYPCHKLSYGGLQQNAEGGRSNQPEAQRPGAGTDPSYKV